MSLGSGVAASVMLRSIAGLSLAIQPVNAGGDAYADKPTAMLHNVFRTARWLRAIVDRELFIARRIIVLTCSCGIFPTGRRTASWRAEWPSQLDEHAMGPTGNDV